MAWVWAWCAWLALAIGSPPVLADGPGNACNTDATPLTQARRIVTRGTETLADGIVQLPDAVPRQWRDQQVRLQYELDVSACSGMPSAALSLFRVGAPYVIEINGQPLPSLLTQRWLWAAATSANSPSARAAPVYNGRIPAAFALPPDASTVTVRLLTLPYIPTGLTTVTLGQAMTLLPQTAAQIETKVGFTDAAAGVMLVLALMAGVLWLQRRHDLGFLWMTLACLFWSVRALAYFGHQIWLPPLWFEQLNPYNILLTAVALCAATLANEMQPQRSTPIAPAPDWRHRPRQWLLFALASSSVAIGASILAQDGVMLARGYTLACAATLALTTIWWVCSGRIRVAMRHRVAVVAAYVGLIATAVHDMALVTGYGDPTGPTYLFWGFTLVLVVYALISGDYIIRTLGRAENANLELELRMHRKSSELERSYQQLRRTELAGALSSARLQERERLLRDMHDGLGAHLMTALRGVERAALSRDQIAQSLQDGIDELRLLMDSADMGADLSAALAAWRSRWDSRLGAAGIQLHWHVDDAIETLALDSDTLLQLMRILQEAATNVVKHSGARNLDLQSRLITEPGESTLAIVARDDGRGLPAQDTRRSQRGLKNMAHRASQIGARLSVAGRSDGAAGCEVRLTLPIDPAPVRAERRKQARPETGMQPS